MGMLVEGRWHDDVDRFMVDGAFQREKTTLRSRLDDRPLAQLLEDEGRVVLVASVSCPWSHGAVLARLFRGLSSTIPLHLAVDPRVEGYALAGDGPLKDLGFRYVHQLYTSTDRVFTGRATVPVLWDQVEGCILSDESDEIMRAFNSLGDGPDLYPSTHAAEIEAFLPELFEGLSNAVYRAGLAEKQSAYEDATASVYSMLHELEARLEQKAYLFGDHVTVADIRLFATLVRYDSVYATHFRCTKYRLTDFPALWRFTRRMYQSPGVAKTVDFEAIRRGYYLNDGSHNPHKIVPDQPVLDWWNTEGLSSS